MDTLEKAIRVLPTPKIKLMNVTGSYSYTKISVPIFQTISTRAQIRHDFRFYLGGRVVGTMVNPVASFLKGCGFVPNSFQYFFYLTPKA